MLGIITTFPIPLPGDLLPKFFQFVNVHYFNNDIVTNHVTDDTNSDCITLSSFTNI